MDKIEFAVSSIRLTNKIRFEHSRIEKIRDIGKKDRQIQNWIFKLYVQFLYYTIIIENG